MPHNNVVLCSKLTIWNYDTNKIHSASQQINKVFDEVNREIFLVEFSMSSEKQCLIAKLFLRNNNAFDCLLPDIKMLTREIAGILADIYCGGNDNDISTNWLDDGVLFEIHQNPIYDEND